MVVACVKAAKLFKALEASLNEFMTCSRHRLMFRTIDFGGIKTTKQSVQDFYFGLYVAFLNL
jgi:hypothetical protein